jgi:hypothetical protein
VSALEHGGPRFLDGMRVAREHLEHLRDPAIGGGAGVREAIGAGRVAYGLRVDAVDEESVRVGPGLAFDGGARSLALREAVMVPVAPEGSRPTYLAIVHVSRSEGVVDGIPTLVFDDVAIETRAAAPAYDDGAVPFAGVRIDPEGLAVFQKGEWYLPPLYHGHSGEFLEDHGRWRYDGDRVGSDLSQPDFDTGFVRVRSGESISLVHGLQSMDLIVQAQARAGSIVTTRGFGDAFFYELPNEQEITLVRGSDLEGDLELRAVMWRLGVAGAGPLLPLADAGDDQIVDMGEAFSLGGGRSRAFGGKSVAKYVWTKVE